MRRPCLVLFISFAIGVYAGIQFGFSSGFGPALCTSLWITCAFYKVRFGSKSAYTVGLLVLVATAGALRSNYVAGGFPRHHLVHFDDRVGETVLEGEVSTPVETREKGSRFGLNIRSITIADTVFKSVGGILVNCKGFVPAISLGDLVRCVSKIDIPQPARNPGAFDYAAYLFRKGFHLTGRIVSEGDLQVISTETSSSLDRLISVVRAHVRGTIRQNLSGAPAALVEGVLLGDKSQLPDSVRDDFSRAGVSHVLAVSGLHVGLVAAGVFFCIRSFGGSGVASSLGTTCGVWLYALVTGLPASVVRAASVATLVVWARSGQRQVDGLNALGCAGIVLLAFRPLDILDLGFQLSFAATGGILVLHRPFTHALSIRRGGGGAPGSRPHWRYRWRPN